MQILPDIYQITLRGVNIFVITEEKLTLVDTGLRGSLSGIGRYLKKLNRSTEEIGLIIATHNHLDHVGGMPQIREVSGAKVAVHTADLGNNLDELPYHGIIRQALKVPPVRLLRPLVFARPGDVDFELKGGETLKPLGGLKVIHTPGHTPGSISLYSKKHKLLFVGDAINNRFIKMRYPPKAVSSDIQQAVNSVKKLAELDLENICFGHGRPVLGNARRRLKRELGL